MSTKAVVPDEVEQARQALAGELASDEGANWAAVYRPGTYGCHELHDRAALVSALLERNLLSDRACVANPEWYRLAEWAAETLQDLSQGCRTTNP